MGSICVGIDGSAGSVAALRWAVDESNLRRCEITAVIAWQFPAGHGGLLETRVVPLETFVDNAAATLEQIIETVLASEAERSKMQRLVKLGDATSVLVDESHNHDLMIVGARGHTGLLDLILGSTATHLTKHSACSVVVVRDSSG
jgi:nucleotide-binding universal stress UspA family protein